MANARTPTLAQMSDVVDIAALLIKPFPAFEGRPEDLRAAVQAMHPEEPNMPYERAVQLVMILIQGRLMERGTYIDL